ncbi:MAG: FAD-binding oxidoreductase [Rhodospirillaceae bacterium]|nr:FAD-binding oxidoreductase [Rhodospirillaceae bacterium]
MSEALDLSTGSHSALIDTLTKLLGEENVITEESERAYYSQDVYGQGPTVLAVIQPDSKEKLAKSMAAITAAGVALFPRGGGFSYTDGYIPTTSNGVTVDTSEMNRIVEINTEDMYVTVETGCTWAALEDALKDKGVRPVFWGPFSGLNATVGGSLSQGSVTYGSSKHGPSGVAAEGMEVVLADGTIVTTGSAGQPNHSPFFRHYGPDLTGLFCNDAGALGIKATITLRLQPRLPVVMGLSYGFETFDGMQRGMAAAAREGLPTEAFGFDATVMKVFTGGQGLAQDLKTLWAVGMAGRNIFAGLWQVLKIAMAGKRFIDKAQYTAHFICEARDTRDMKSQLAALRNAVGPHGNEIVNTVPAVVRAYPFPPFSLMGTSGERWLAMHGILPFSKVEEFKTKIDALYDRYSDKMAQHNIVKASMFTTIATNAFLFEPVFYWDDSRAAFINRHTDPEVLKAIKNFEPNIEGRKVVSEMKQSIIDCIYECGGTHMQIGKAYPYTRERDEGALNMVKSLKAHVDPKGLMNPGALGL